MSGLRRALLVAGNVKAGSKDRRHFSDLRRWGTGLIRRGFECRACVGDGAALAVSGLQTYAGRRNGVQDQLDWLAELGEGDHGVLVVANHGSQLGISCFGTGPVTPADLSARFSGCEARIAMVFGQCHAGIFGSVARSASRVAVVAACSGAQQSRATPDGSHNEFLHQLYDAWFAEKTTSPSLDAAFNCAKDAVRTLCLLEPHDQCEHAEIHDPRGVAATFVL